jgi:LPXTG-motif cell wall-anchored protein
MAYVMAATAVVGTLTGIVNSVASISDMNKRRNFVQALSALDNDQKLALNKQLLDAKSNDARQAIIGNILGQLDTARIQGLTTVQTEKEKTNKTVTTVAIIAGAVLLLGVIVLMIKKRK